MRKLSKDEKEFRKAKRLMDQLMLPAYDAVMHLKIEELELVKKWSDELTPTNCWWGLYRARAFLKTLVNSELEERPMRK